MGLQMRGVDHDPLRLCALARHLQERCWMIGGPAGQLRDHALKPQLPQIQLVDEDVNHPDRIVLADIIVEILRSKTPCRLSSPSTKRFIKNPDSIRQDSTSANVFTQPRPFAGIRFEEWEVRIRPLPLPISPVRRVNTRKQP